MKINRFALFSMLTLALSCCFSTLFAQYPGYKDVADIAAFKTKYMSESAKIQSITSNFTQEKTMSAVANKVSSDGKFWFKRSNKLRMEYVKPQPYTLVMSADKVSINENGKEKKMNAASSKVFKEINRVVMDCIQGSILDSKDFSTRVFENDKTYLLEMTPNSKAFREFFKDIVLVIEKTDFTARSIAMNEPAGDKTVITFTGKKLNQQVADSLFNI